MKNKSIYKKLALITFLILHMPEQVWAVSSIDNELSDFKSFILDNVLETVAVVALVLWALNAFFGWWRGGTDWRAGIGMVFLNIIAFAAVDIVAFLK